MPSKKASDGEYRDIAHPINSTTRDAMQKQIMEAYENALTEEEQDRDRLGTEDLWDEGVMPETAAADLLRRFFMHRPVQRNMPQSGARVARRAGERLFSYSMSWMERAAARHSGQRRAFWVLPER